MKVAEVKLWGRTIGVVSLYYIGVIMRGRRKC